MAGHFVRKGTKLLKQVFKNGDEVVQNTAKKAPKPPPRVLPKSEYSGKANGHKDFGRFKADMAVVTDQRKGLQKPQFRGDDGRLNYHQFNGKGEKSSFRDVNVKQEEVLKRDQKGKLQTKREVRGTFLEDKPQVVDVDSHHITPVKSLAFLFDGLDEFEARKLINYFEKKGVYIGNDPRNAKHLSKPDHTSVHNEYVKKALLKYDHASLAGMSMKDRLKFVKVMVDEIKQANEIVAKYNSPAMTAKEFSESVDRVHRPELAGYE